MIEDADPEDRRVHVSEIRHGYNLGKDLELTDGDQAVHRTVVDYGGTTIGPYLEFAKPLGKSFAAGETVVRYPEEYMYEILGGVETRTRTARIRSQYAPRTIR